MDTSNPIDWFYGVREWCTHVLSIWFKVILQRCWVYTLNVLKDEQMSRIWSLDLSENVQASILQAEVYISLYVQYSLLFREQELLS